MDTPMPSYGTDRSGRVEVSRREVGALELLDLQLITERQGHESLPYPFMLTRPTRFEFVDEIAGYASHLPDRLHSGDLSVFAGCLRALARADITVTGHVQYLPADTPSIRVLAFSAGQAGYLLEQRADADVVDVYAVPPFELGPAIASAMSLEQPGTHPRILNPEYVPAQPAVEDEADVVVRHGMHTEAGVMVSISQVSAYGTVQSDWRPMGEWGVDPRKESLIWVRIADDGDYLGTTDRSSGIPLTAAILRDRIDDLISDDLETLREARGE